MVGEYKRASCRSRREPSSARTKFSSLWESRSVPLGTGVMDIYRQTVDGAGNDAPLLASDKNKIPRDWSPDSAFLLYEEFDPENLDDNLGLAIVGRLPVESVGPLRNLCATVSAGWIKNADHNRRRDASSRADSATPCRGRRVRSTSSRPTVSDSSSAHCPCRRPGQLQYFLAVSRHVDERPSPRGGRFPFARAVKTLVC